MGDFDLKTSVTLLTILVGVFTTVLGGLQFRMSNRLSEIKTSADAALTDAETAKIKIEMDNVARDAIRTQIGMLRDALKDSNDSRAVERVESKLGIAALRSDLDKCLAVHEDASKKCNEDYTALQKNVEIERAAWRAREFELLKQIESLQAKISLIQTPVFATLTTPPQTNP